MSSTAIIGSRKELKEVLQHRMAESYDSIRDDQRLDENQTYLKTYLIESERKHFSPEIIGTDKYTVETARTEDEGFLNIFVDEGEGDPREFYLDKLNHRFWSIHTLAESTLADDFIEKLVFPRFTQLDFPWFSNRFLRQIGIENNFRSFSLKFEDEFGRLGDSPDSDVPGMSMRLWGEGRAKQVFELLSSDENVGPSTSLSNVGIRREFGDGATLLEDITNQGKFTARGESVDGHFYQLNQIRQRYEDILNILENTYSISRKSHGSGAGISGSPLTIDFNRKIENFEAFFDTLLASKKPFRLWGVYNHIGEDYYRVSAVDQHTGDEVNLEVSRDWIRIYLPEGTCGNVVLRVYSIIQHYFDSQAELSGVEHDTIV